ncbi:MAG: response regulator [Bdellovibrionales bacterium]
MLIVDDNADYCCLLSKTLEQRIHAHTTSVLSGKLAIEALRVGKFDVMICDFEMPGMNGFDVFQAMIAEDLFCPFLLYTNADLSRLPRFEGPGFLGIVKKMEAEKLFKHLDLLILKGSD